MDIRIDKTPNGYEVYLKGKLYEIYRGSQDIVQLEAEIRARHCRVYEEMEMERIGRNWWRRLEAGMEANTWYDAIFLLLETKLKNDN